MAAVVAARLAKFIQSSLAPLYKDISIHLWSDSQIVLHWLHSHKKLKQFVASGKLLSYFLLQHGDIAQQQITLLIYLPGASTQHH